MEFSPPLLIVIGYNNDLLVHYYNNGDQSMYEQFLFIQFQCSIRCTARKIVKRTAEKKWMSYHLAYG